MRTLAQTSRRIERLAMLLAAGAVLASSPSLAGERVLHAPPCALTEGGHGTVEAVLSPVELRLADGAVLRLAGIEEPLAPLDRDDGGWPPAEAALEGLRMLVEGKAVHFLVTAAATDRHGRRLVHVHLDDDGTWVQQALVRQGVVRVAATADGWNCLEALYPAEREARTAGRGLWGNPFYLVKSAAEPSLRLTNQLYEVVEGRVMSTGRTPPAAYLNFGRAWSNDFTVIIPAPIDKELGAAGVSLDALAGRLLRVRGWLEQRDGPLIRISDPRQIEVLDD